MSTEGNVAFFGLLGAMTVIAYFVAIAMIFVVAGLVLAVIMAAVLVMALIRAWAHTVVLAAEEGGIYAVSLVVSLAVTVASSLIIATWLNNRLDNPDPDYYIHPALLVMIVLAVWIGTPLSGLAVLFRSWDDDSLWLYPLLAFFTVGVVFHATMWANLV